MPLTSQQKQDLRLGLRSNALGDQVISQLEAYDDSGIIPNAILEMSAQPVTTNTFGIGGDTYEFVTSAGNVADDANIAIEIAGSAEDTRDNAIEAINATDTNNQHANINNVADDAPALANGTENVLADGFGDGLRVQPTQGAPGDPAFPSNPSLVLAEAITDAADIWDVGNVNMNTLGGRAVGSRKSVVAQLTVTAAMITKGDRRIRTPFTPTAFSVAVETSAGVRRVPGADSYAIGSEGVTITLNGGGAPAIQATDIVTMRIWE